MFDWNDTRYFLAVAREGSTLAAAKVLGVNQSTVHRHLAALEKDLGCRLVERRPTGYRVTEQGRQLHACAERIEEGVAALQRRVASFNKELSGRIRTTCSAAVGHRLMKSGLLDTFHKRYPGLKVELVMTERLLSLSNGEADVAIRGGDPKDESLVGRKIADVAWGIYATRPYVERHGRPASAEDIDRHSIIKFVDGIADHRAARWLRSKAPRATVCGEGGNIPSVLLAVKSGAGLAPLPAPLADHDEELLRLLGPIPELAYPMHLLTHRDLRNVPRITAFFDFCVSELRPVLRGGAMRAYPSKSA